MKPSIPQGTRDFGPDVVRKRNYIFDTIKSVFELYGYEPLETPAMENLETLMGKYGDEGDKLIFQILDSGNRFDENFFKAFIQHLQNHDALYRLISKEKGLDSKNPFENPFKSKSPEELALIAKELFENKDYENYLPSFKKKISSKALRYDLTIPFARYVAMNHNQLTFPFKLYQMQPVWRADRPQKGRYREFYQCDADVVGSNSLLNDIELAEIYLEVFKKLKIDVELKINSRKILAALAQLSGSTTKMIDITTAIDKLDKVGIQKVNEELAQKELSGEQINIIENYLSITGNNQDKLGEAKKLFENIEEGKKGIEELEFILNYLEDRELQIDFTLARGLNYYTGIIYEIKAKNVTIGSIGGGGRYDDLTGLFGVPNIPGVGISFGVDRIYDVMEELKLFPTEVHTGTKVLFFNMGNEENKFAFAQLQLLRNSGISAELFHIPAKMDKQFKYADKKNIPFAVIIGSKEIAEKNFVVKDLKKGEQQTLALTELVNYFKDYFKVT
jgi:histidyl-tRNA synthetase